MNRRAEIIEQFLKSCGWNGAGKTPVTGDASNRRYLRLVKPNGTSVILMDAPPEKNDPVTPFIDIARHLRSLDLSAPETFESDTKSGLLLVEDLGDNVFANLLENRPELETEFYETAVDVLVRLYGAPVPGGLTSLTPAILADMTAPAFDWYIDEAKDTAQSVDFVSEFGTVLSDVIGDVTGLTLRDYHAENLIWLPERKSVARAGLIDFQDALRGHPAYDLVSLLQDARRDVSPALEARMISRFIALTGQDRASFEAAYSALGAQRNLRIIGIFARLCVQSGRPGYLEYIPRVWACFIRDLEHPALAPVRRSLLQILPEPTSEYLDSLREKCPKTPNL